MTRLEFGKVMAYVTAGTGKALTTDSLEVYYDCLGDLSFDALMISAKRVLLEHRWASFPSIAEFREAASATVRGVVSELSTAEAWEMAWRAMSNIDPEVEGAFERGTRALPPVVVETIQTFGIHAMCYGEEPVGVVRGQFMKIYEQLSARDRREALLPTSTLRAIEDKGRAQLPGKVVQAIASIGQLPE